MIWGFWLAVSCFCALNTPGHGGVWISAPHWTQAECERVREAVTASASKCERRVGP